MTVTGNEAGNPTEEHRLIAERRKKLTRRCDRKDSLFRTNTGAPPLAGELHATYGKQSTETLARIIGRDQYRRPIDGEAGHG